eukprot:jgi/Bigna1/70822/fgenesh1_pg.13_\
MSGPDTTLSPALEILLSKEVLNQWDSDRLKIKKVTVSDPETLKIQFPPQMVITYLVVMDAKGARADEKYESLDPAAVEVKPKGVRRRYSDFVWLRNMIRKCFPGLLIPLLPPKKVFGNKEHTFVKSRCAKLQEFLERVVSRYEFIARSRPFILFVTKHKDEFEREKKRIERLLAKIESSVRCELYEKLFQKNKKLLSSEIPKDPSDIVHFMKTFLEESKTHISSVATSAAIVRVCERVDGFGLADVIPVLVSFMRLYAQAAIALATMEEDNRSQSNGAVILSVYALLFAAAVIYQAEDFKQISSHAYKIYSNMGDSKAAEAASDAEVDVDLSGRVLLKTRVEKMGEQMERMKGSHDRIARDARRELDDTKAMIEIVNDWQLVYKRLEALRRSNKEKDAAEKEGLEKLSVLLLKILFHEELKFYWTNKIERFKDAHSQFAAEQLKIAETVLVLIDHKRGLVAVPGLIERSDFSFFLFLNGTGRRRRSFFVSRR